MRVVVVGGVAAGMSAAARLRRLDEDAEIIVLEKSPFVSYANCGLPYYVGGEIEEQDSLLVQTPERLKEALNLDIRVNHEVISLDAAAHEVVVRRSDAHRRVTEETMSYDALVLAPGAQAIRPELPGFDSGIVWHLRTVPDAVEIRHRVDSGITSAVVLGAGFIGLEAAEALAEQGVETTIVELSPHVLPAAEPELASYLADELRRLKIRPIVGVGARRIDAAEGFGNVVLSDGRSIPTDLVVLAIGVRPATRAFEGSGLELHNGAIVVDEHGRTNLPDVWAGGDAVASHDPLTGQLRPVPLAGPANRAGRLIADDIAAEKSGGPKPRAIAEPLSSAVVRVGSLTLAMTGANRRSLDAAGSEYHTINLHPNDHAGYFPGASQIHLVVHFAKEDGRLLGAQAVGKAGVDKRIDVLATALRSGACIGDLIDLDLSYSPPYGSAKDPVNYAGYYGQDVMEGVTRLWYPQEAGYAVENCLVLDVRSPAEFATGHLPCAVNIPHTEVRERLDEIRSAAAGRPIRVNCQSGVRSYLAERILVQEGFSDVKNLSGGMLTMRAAIKGGLVKNVELVR